MLTLGKVPEKENHFCVCKERPLAKARLEKSKAFGTSIVFDPVKTSGIGIALRSGQIVRTILRFTVPKDAKPGEQIEFNLLQRSEDGQVLGGISIQVNIQKPKPRRRKPIEKTSKRKVAKGNSPTSSKK